MQGKTDIEMQRPSRAPTSHPVLEPQSFQTREPTTFKMMGMIGDPQRTVVDLAFGLSAPPSTISHAGNFTPEDSPLLRRIVIEIGQPEAIPSLGNDMPTTIGLRSDVATQTFDQAKVSGKNKIGTDSDPYEHLLWAVEALKTEGLNRQQVLAVVAQIMDDAFATQNESSLNQEASQKKGWRTRNVPSNPNPTLGRD